MTGENIYLVAQVRNPGGAVDVQRHRRKLAAILSADAVGYSRLMAEDEVATVCTLTSYRTEISTLVT